MLASKSRISYPWPTILLSLVMVGWFYLGTNESLTELSRIPTKYFRPSVQLVGLVVYFIVVFVDIARFFKSRANYDARLTRHQHQIDDLFSAKQDLQIRANTHAGHADKLKMFISDRLLEYIEYDEKFLHFKNIAAEVRHNGVISYDKVQTALKGAMQNDSDERYRQALQSMDYLWDLLDLSTTDNIALHVANKLYACEEHYFQAQLEDEPAERSPFLPTYSAHLAVRSAMLPLIGDNVNQRDHRKVLQAGEDYHDGQFHICLNETDELLGNINHLILLVENLVNNALFYTGKARYKNPHARVAVALRQNANNAELSVYNHGPHIKEKHRDKIFQLGFSTRQIRDLHGKGLGLHFVNQIVQGYEGSMRYENICNIADTLSIRISLVGGEVETRVVEMQADGQKVLCRSVQSENPPSKKLDWSFSNRILKIEVISLTSDSVSRLVCDKTTTSTTLVDTEGWAIPRWYIAVQCRKRSAKLTFQPLDVTGVRFVVALPTARSRLEYEDKFFGATS